eukprot:m.297426 g.297426  ORF g.297426 m.297426 type:complete len:604 (+) comp13608_c0_seq1:73-1884(+)
MARAALSRCSRMLRCAALLLLVAAAVAAPTSSAHPQDAHDTTAPVLGARFGPDGTPQIGPYQVGDVAWGTYSPKYEATGWDTLEIHTAPGAPDDKAAFLAGFIEGSKTAARIWTHAQNSGVVGYTPSTKLADFLSQNNAWMAQQIATNSTSPYWYQLQLVLQQLHGMRAGYLGTPTGAKHSLSLDELLLLNLGGDMEDLAAVFGDNNDLARAPAQRWRAEHGDKLGETPLLTFGPGHCSALIKLLDQSKDLFVSQVTWSSFNSMTRIYKLYDFPFTMSGQSGSIVPGRKSSFSSYPGTLFSGDDFYLLSSGLVVMETTIGNSNSSLNQYIQPTTVLEWMRNILANRLASSAPTWAQIYSQYNSGTYNNQNMVVDTSKFTPGQPLPADTFWVVEQIPGHIVSNDLSSKLQSDGYFGSYNTPYDPRIRAINGVTVSEKQYGDWFSYERTPRARIFARNHTSVTDLESMKRLMRYNNYKADPLSTQLNTCQFIGWTNCTPPYTTENTIATRGDLNPADGVYGFAAFKQRNHVATDAKIMSVTEFDADRLPSYAVAGPPSDQVPPFVWTTSPYANTPHFGMPDKMVFDWIRVDWAQQQSKPKHVANQ